VLRRRKDLENFGWLRFVRHGRINSHADRWELILDNAETHPHPPISGDGYVELRPTEDAFRFQGLGSSSELIWELILEEPSTVAEIAAHVRLSRDAVRQNLRRLRDFGLAKETNRIWYGLDRSVVDIAQEVGSYGIGKAQARRHQRQREEFQNRPKKQLIWGRKTRPKNRPRGQR